MILVIILFHFNLFQKLLHINILHIKIQKFIQLKFIMHYLFIYSIKIRGNQINPYKLNEKDKNKILNQISYGLNQLILI